MSSQEEQSNYMRSDPSPELRLHAVHQQPPQLPPQLPLTLPSPHQPISAPPFQEQPPGRSWYFNTAFAGPSRVGKTKLLQRFVKSCFSDGYTETTETTSASKSVAIGRHNVLFQCWDTPGQETLTDGLDQQLQFPHALFILFDVSRNTFAELERWCRLVDTCGPPRPLLVLVGNKCDLGVHAETLARARELKQAESGLLFVLSILADDENMEVDAMMLEVGKALTERHSLSLLPLHSVGPSGEEADKPQKEFRDGKKPEEEGPTAFLRHLLAVCCCLCC